MTAPNWFTRYRRGDQSRVWHELRQLGGTVTDPALVAEAQLVCDEMARRARHNVELIIDRLRAGGYRFHTNDDAQTPVRPFVPATASAAEHACWLQQSFGPVPMTVRSWLRLVGDVWLVGTHPRWPESAAADPLVIELEGSRYPGASMRDFFGSELDAWREQAAEDSEPGVFVLPMTPDRLTKDNVSGGLPYGIALPDGCVDGLFVAETTMPFVAYLNGVFRHGGFPGPAPSTSAGRVKQALATGLLPL